MAFDNLYLLVLLLLIPLLLFIAGLIFYLLVRSWRTKTRRDLNRSQKDLRRLRNERNLIRSDLDNFSDQEPEPYGSQLSVTRGQLSEVSEGIKKLERSYISINERIRGLESRGAVSVFKNPTSWRSFYREVQDLRQDVSEIGKSLAAAQETQTALHEIAWATACEVRTVNPRLEEVRADLDLLHTKNLSGPLLDSAFYEIESIQARIAAIPVYFLSNEKSVVIQDANKSEVVEAHNTLDELNSNLDELSRRAQEWEEQYERMQTALSKMGVDVGELETLISDMPPDLQLSQEKAQYEGSMAVSQNLAASAAHSLIEELETTAKEANQVSRSSRELSAKLGKAKREFNHLALAIETTTRKLEAVSEKMADLATREIYPVAWEASTGKLSDIKSRSTEIGGITKERRIGDISQDLRTCARLNSSLDSLFEHVQSIQSEHVKLEKIFSGAEYQGVDTWLADAHQTVRQAQEFAAENWPRTESVSSLPEDLLDLEKELLRLVPDTVPQPLLETGLGTLLADSREMDAGYREMRLRISSVARRLEEIQEIEKTAKNRLESASGALSQVRYIVRSNEFLSKIAGKDNERYLSEIKELEAGLQDRRAGSVESKLKRIDSALSRMETSLNKWLNQLKEAIDGKVNLIKSSLEVLDKDLYLDENAVADARGLIHKAADASRDSLGTKGRYPIEKIPNHLKRSNDIWQNAAAVLGAFQEVESPVLESYREASHHRENARRLYKDYVKLINKRTNWPPTTAEIKPYQSQYEGLESDWKSLRKQPSRAINLVAKLGGFSTRYQKLAVDLERQTVGAGQEIERVQELEDEISRLVRKWDNLRKSQRDNRDVSQAIRQLIDEAKKESDRIKHDFLRDEIDYEQVILDLGGLLSKIRSAQVPVDEENALNVDGKLLPYG